MKLTRTEQDNIHRMLHNILNDRQVQKMKGYIQHGSVTTYDHCKGVTLTSYWLNKHLRLGADEQALVTGAFLHDFYLYDWHNQSLKNCLHGFTHPKRACVNAVRQFHINTKEQQIIRCHMWPLTLLHIPTCREEWIVTIADKYCSAAETLFQRRRRHAG